MLRRRLSRHPAGFTLVELLVVVTIIVLLIALLIPAVFKIRVIGQETETRNEISQINTAAQTFKNDWGQMPPTQFRLPTRPVSTNLNAVERALEDASFAFLKQRYPRWPAATDLDGSGNINWANHQGMSAYQLPTGQHLQGNQCMVLFLGGPEYTGWAHDRPAAPSGTAVSKSFYLEIKSTKLKAGNDYGYPSAAAVYLDPFETPYLYWGSNKVGGKYSEQTATLFIDQPQLNWVHPDLPGVSGTVNAYQEATNKYANENMCQIISAGPNQKFGSGGGTWNPPGVDYIGDGQGADDMANFNNGVRLGLRP